jgi:ribulose-phosphate 3-epimerase
MHEIIPAILPKSVEDLEAKLAALPSAITLFHMDVLEEDIWTDKNTRDFEVHLMVERPEEIMARWIERGAKRVSVHQPSAKLAEYRDRAEIGYAIELDKPLEEYEPFFGFVDFIHLMSIDEIGEQGHPFDEKVFERIKLLQEKYPNLPISVDGGVNKSNYQKLVELGADRLIVGSGFQELWESLVST